MIKFLPLDFLSALHRIPWKNKNAVYRLQISALVPEIFKFEKWVKYANEMTDDVKFEQNLVVYDVITWLICIFEYLWNEKDIWK